ncbi:MAG: SRPBCC domain-containing protein [Mycobacteriales bacterium]|nr:SRPBCC domain-containing protein [Mycobacteriales bacterium]
MPVISTTQDSEALSLTLVSEFPHPLARVWQVWADPRQLERWWGPPTWPATFVQLELVTGGRASYVMTGPDGATSRGWWELLIVDEPKRIELEDGFSDDSGNPNRDMPTTRTEVVLHETSEGTRMTVTSHFASAEQMTQLVEMGMVEGITSAAGQIDAILDET